MTTTDGARGWSALIVLIIGLFISLGCSRVWALPLMQPIDLAHGGDEVVLTDALWLHEETPGQSLTIAEVLQTTEWEPTSPENLSSAYRPTTVWLLGTIRNRGETPLSRWLVLLPWQLHDVQLFLIDPATGDVSTHQHAGLGVARETIEVAMIQPTFAIELAPGQTRTLVLRVQDRSFLGLTVRGVESEAFVAKERSRRDLYLIFAGFVLAIMVVLLSWGDWRFTLASVWLGCIILFELSYEIPLVLSLWPGLRPHMISLFTISGALTIAVFALASLVFLEIYRNRAWRILYGILIGGILVAAFATPLTDETQLTRWVTVRLTLVIALLWPISVVFAPRRQGPYQWGVLILLVGCWLQIVVRIFTSTGLMPRIHDDVLVMLYRLVPLGLILGVIVLDRLARLSRERARERELRAIEEASRQALIDRQQEENLRLTAAVEQQTRTLREATRLAEESSEAKSAFLSMVSHELRAPLHDILGYAQLLARQIPPQAQEQLAVIQDGGTKLLHLINDILAFSRGEARPIILAPVPLSLRRLAAHLSEVCRPLATHGDNRLVTRVELGETEWVMGDEPRLTQILRNLLENACKFTQAGRIELAITHGEPRRAPGADAVVCFCVSDTGPGIPESEQDAIFQPFKRLDRYQSVPGLGLGLAIAQQLATAMGGKIQVRSSQGEHHGSAFGFTVRLPICDPPEPQWDAEQRPSGYQGRRRTLLIADDFPTSRQFLADCCTAWGFRVILAVDGADALARFRAADPAFDAALVDQFMPHLDGWGFLRGVREADQGSELPVILISAAPQQRPEGYPESVQFDQFAIKPLSESHLAVILGDILGLEWEYAEESSLLDPAPPAALPASCTAAERARFLEMLSIGQLKAIQQWAQEMAERDPEHKAEWSNIIHLCAVVDLPGLQRLARAAGEG